ncbi:TPA: hypothetical protein DIV55_05640 [Patescibacteria group bacterium]|uniref:Uncharacterized protein n=1 Tax=Candidatus Gottesmanbacteria bacterium GW2011_GWA1_43_11 TaxID=1618436 RepID=A0A0G1FFK1_9BACT|nr:MAG: hypothetical protein UV59_C0006G0079 [Candidatus Gottesmanbacteria bacterium GW2011_GWA1_43_11]HCS79191.1 hypothetical protein [Patescibacteria group bacterium]
MIPCQVLRFDPPAGGEKQPIENRRQGNLPILMTDLCHPEAQPKDLGRNLQDSASLDSSTSLGMTKGFVCWEE